MGCGWYRIGDATVHVNFGSGRAAKACVHCGGLASKLCDHQVADTGAGWKSATCDAPICEACALHVPGKDLDYCKHHAKHHTTEIPLQLPLDAPAAGL